MLLHVLVTVGPPLGTRTAVMFRPAVTFRPVPPTCQEVALPPPIAFTSVLGGPHGTRLAQGHPLAYRQSSAAVASSYARHAMAPLPPPHVSLSVSTLPAPPCPLLPLFESVTPPPQYELLFPTSIIMGPLPAPRPSSQSTPQLPAPVAGNPAFPSPPPAVRASTSINHWSLFAGRLPAEPSAKPERRKPSSASQGKVGHSGVVHSW